MANFIYGKAKEALFNGLFSIQNNSFKVLLVNNSYVPNELSHTFVSDINSSFIKNRSQNLVNLTNNYGVIDADDVIIDSHDGTAFNAVVLYQVGFSDSNSRLLAYIDTATGIPYSGSNATGIPITIVWSNGPNKIIRI